MQTASGRHDEQTAEKQRIAALHELGILDTERETEYDQIVELAAAICGTPISSCTLVDEDRQWFKASKGITVRETERQLSFCSHAIEQTDLMVVEDATKDERFSHHPWVTGDASVRFYAGMPLPDQNGNLLGTLCVVDIVPRQLTDIQKSALRVLTAQLSAHIELNAEKRRLKCAIAEKDRLLKALQSSDDRFRKFMNNGPFLSYIRDEEARFVFYSDQVAERFQTNTTAWLGKTLAELFPMEDASFYHKSDMEALISGNMVEVVEETKDASGHSTFWRSFKFGFKNEHDRPMIGGISVDITAEIQIKRDLEHKGALLERYALTDALTGLANRHAVEVQTEIEMTRCSERGLPFSLILLDIDNFKAINDTYGHNAGDEVLRRLGGLLVKAVRSTDVAARFGGEEMIILLPGANSAQAMLSAERIREKLHVESWPHGPVTASFGVATLDDVCSNYEELVAQADLAMYRAKQSGKDRIVCADSMST